MHPVEERHLDLTRRRFFKTCAHGVGGALGPAALGSLLASEALGLGSVVPASSRAAKVTGVHFRPRAKRVIYMHMEGAPSQLDLWDYKPGLRSRYNQDLPDSIRRGQRSHAQGPGARRSLDDLAYDLAKVVAQAQLEQPGDGSGGGATRDCCGPAVLSRITVEGHPASAAAEVDLRPCMGVRGADHIRAG